MEKYVEQYQAWGGGLTRPIWPDMQGWQEGNFSMTEMPGPPVPGWFRKMLLTAKHRTERDVSSRQRVSLHTFLSVRALRRSPPYPWTAGELAPSP
jgi:hypothetical protein